MENILFSFNREKAIEVILYIAAHTQSKLSIMKIMYLADKSSLEEYGRFLCGETYGATIHGAIPIYTYRMLYGIDSITGVGFDIDTGTNIIVNRSPNTDELSQSDLEILDNTLKQFGKTTLEQLIHLSCDNAWKNVWKTVFSPMIAVIPVYEIALTLDDSDLVIDYLFNGNSD